MAAVNKVLILNGGQQEKFGLKETVFKTGKRAPVKTTLAQLQRAKQHAQQIKQAQKAPVAQQQSSQSVNTAAAKVPQNPYLPKNPYLNERA